MKNILYIVLLISGFNACKPKDDCPEFSPLILCNKDSYKQYETIHMKLLYSDRATCKWTVNGHTLATTTNEYSLPASSLTDREIYCEATLGSCVQNTSTWIIVQNISIPSCTINHNTFSAGTTEMKISNMAYDPKTLTFSGKITGVGASVNDSIKVVMPKSFNANDIVNVYDVASPQNSNNGEAYVQVRYGNLVFTGPSGYSKIVYRRVSNQVGIECCSLLMSNSSLSPPTQYAKFQFEFNF